MNSSYDNEPRIAAEPTITLHPVDAEVLGLAEGITARVHNEAGALSMRVAISEKPCRVWPGRRRACGLDAERRFECERAQSRSADLYGRQHRVARRRGDARTTRGRFYLIG